MSLVRALLPSLSAAAIAGAGAAFAIPQAIPTYTFCEEEDNDLCTEHQVLDASLAVMQTGGVEEVRDCFYLTGKLQKDCVWDREPKCQIRAYGKPEPARDSSGRVVNGEFCEPLVATSVNGAILGLAPNSDGTIRLAVGALLDGFDGTFNGLAQNDLHGETGTIIIEIFETFGARGTGSDDPDDSYVWTGLMNGSDALRVAFSAEPLRGGGTYNIFCRTDRGQTEICWDVDFYEARNLLPGRAYCVTMVGGLDEFCQKTPIKLGWFDKNCNLLDTAIEGPHDLPTLCVFADGDGNLRFGVSGAQRRFAIPLPREEGPTKQVPGDCNFNGLYDPYEEDYFFFLTLLEVLEVGSFEHHPGASLKDGSADLVNRFPRSVWDDELELVCGLFPDFPLRPGPCPLLAGQAPEKFFAHGICGGYCLKIELAEHVSPGERPTMNPDPFVMSRRSDMNGDGVVNSSDLAVLLSHWGQSSGF